MHKINKRASLLVAILLLVSITSFVFAEPISVQEAMYQAPYRLKEDFKKQLKAYDLINAKSTQNDITAIRSLYDKFGIRLSEDERVQFDIIENTTLKKTEISIELQDLTSSLTVNSLNQAIRQMYSAAISLQGLMASNELKLDIASYKLKIGQVKLNQGQITALDFKELELNLTKDQLAFDQSKIDFENMVAQLEARLNVPVTISVEPMNQHALRPLDYYLSKVDNRMELKSLVLSNDIQRLEWPYYDSTDYLSKDQKLAYQDSKLAVSLNEIKHHAKRSEILAEIHIAYNDTQKLLAKVETYHQQINSQKARLDQLNALYKSGLIVETNVKELQAAIIQLEAVYHSSIVDYNTSRMRLNQAVSAGPAY